MSIEHRRPASISSLSRARGRSLLATALAFAALLYAGAANADARTEARRHFKTGMALIAQKRFPEGIKELEKAYEILPHPNVAYNIAQAQAEGGSLELAIKAYRTYLASDPPDREEVQKVVQQLQEKLAEQKAAAQKAAEPKPVEPKPVEQGPVEQGPVEPKPPAQGPVEPPVPVAVKPAAPASDAGKIVGQARTEDIYQETVVTASRGAQSPLDSPNSTTIITRQDIRLSGITRIPELLRRVAGMDVMQITGGDTNVSMRGFNSRLANKLLVLVNGRSVYNDILGSTFWEMLTIDVDQIERIEVVRGPGSALYGADAFAGVVNILTIAPGEGRTGYRFGVGDHYQGYGSAWAAGRVGDFAYRASVGYTRYPRWTRELQSTRRDVTVADFDQNLAVENLRADVRMSRRINKDNELLFGGGFSRSQLDLYGIGPFNDYQFKADNLDLGADYKGRYVNARAYFTHFGGSSSVDYAYIGHTMYDSHPHQNIFNAEVEYVNDFRLPRALHHDVHVGVGYRLKDVAWEYLEPSIPLEHHGAAYLQDTIKIGSKVSVVGSGRLDYVPYLGRIVGSPRGSVVIKPTDRQAVRFSGSTAFRAPSYLEARLALPIQLTLPGLEIVSSSRSADRPDFVVQPEQVTTVEASYLNQQSDSFEFELTAYYNRVTDLIVLAVNRNVSLSGLAAGWGGLNPDTGRYNAAYGGWDAQGNRAFSPTVQQSDAYNVFGGELGVRVYPLEGLDFFANYAINYTHQQHAPGSANPLDDQRTSHHKVNVGAQWRTKFGFNGELTFHYQSPQVWTEQVATTTAIVYKQYPLPAYTLLNGRLGYRFYRDKIELSAVVFNALAEIAAIGDSDSTHTLGPQMHPFGNRVGRRFMGFFSYQM